MRRGNCDPELTPADPERGGKNGSDTADVSLDLLCVIFRSHTTSTALWTLARARAIEALERRYATAMNIIGNMSSSAFHYEIRSR